MNSIGSLLALAALLEAGCRPIPLHRSPSGSAGGEEPPAETPPVDASRPPRDVAHTITGDPDGTSDAAAPARDAAFDVAPRSDQARARDSAPDRAAGSPDLARPVLPDVGSAPADPCELPSARQVPVSTVAALKAALTAAQPGDSIQLQAGTFAGKFNLTASGTADQPIILCGPRAAIIDGGSGGYALHVTGSHVVLAGLAIRGGQKTIMLDGASDSLLTDLEVSGSEMEGVHFRMGSSRNVLVRSLVHDTGTQTPDYGEGVYIGSAGGGDASNDNQILNNQILDTAAECIDVKEGTSGGRIAGNLLGGRKISGANFADSWIDVKGNGYLVTGNHGTDRRRC